MKLIKKSILLLALAGGTFLSGGKAYAQQALVDVRVDSAAILIGEQTVLHLTVTTEISLMQSASRSVKYYSRTVLSTYSLLTHLTREEMLGLQEASSLNQFRLQQMNLTNVT